jgi:hypothetical protein
MNRAGPSLHFVKNHPAKFSGSRFRSTGGEDGRPSDRWRPGLCFCCTSGCPSHWWNGDRFLAGLVRRPRPSRRWGWGLIPRDRRRPWSPETCPAPGWKKRGHEDSRITQRARHSPPHLSPPGRDQVWSGARDVVGAPAGPIWAVAPAPDQRSACNGDRSLRSLPPVGRHLETFPHVHYGRSGTDALAPTVVGTYSRGHLDSDFNSVPGSNRSARAAARNAARRRHGL